jgi:diaminohydroxyphosphoribosylaminopyrimidine deaminase/5-amino-6-(5-phosphoribosylamino)uracil reductase
VRLGLVDEYAIYLGPMLLGGPRTAIADIGAEGIGEARALQITAIERLGDDILVIARPTNPPTREN